MLRRARRGRHGSHAGKLIRLLDWVEEHREPLTVDLLRAGLHIADIGTPRLTFPELVAFVTWLPPDSATALSGLTEKERAERLAWRNVESQLLAGILDHLREKAWAEGDRKGPRPYPIPRPGVTDDRQRAIGKDPVPLDEMRAHLGWTSDI